MLISHREPKICSWLHNDYKCVCGRLVQVVRLLIDRQYQVFFFQFEFPSTPLNWVPISLLKARLLNSNKKLRDRAQGIHCPDQSIIKIGKNQSLHPLTTLQEAFHVKKHRAKIPESHPISSKNTVIATKCFTKMPNSSKKDQFIN